MRIFSIFIGILWLAGVAGYSQAAPQAEITAVQADAWVVRGDNSYAAIEHMALVSGDQIRTGEKARVILKLPDDSIVKLGEYSIVNLSNILPPETEGGLFSAALEIVQGVFRFTAEEPAARDIQIKVGKSITAGIRGTDIWGSAWLEGKTLLCLLEGKVAVSSGTTHALLDKPLDYFIVPEGQPPSPVGTLPAEKAQKWITWTELTPVAP